MSFSIRIKTKGETYLIIEYWVHLTVDEMRQERGK
jgi:hypothetical protein